MFAPTLAGHGEFMGGDTRFDEPLPRYWYRPLYFPVPPKLLRQGINHLDIQIKAYSNNKRGLSEVYFGPVRKIEPFWATRYFWQVTSLQITSAITLGLSLLAFPSWTFLGWQPAYFFFGASALLWSLRNTHFLITEIPVSAFQWELFADHQRFTRVAVSNESPTGLGRAVARIHGVNKPLSQTTA